MASLSVRSIHRLGVVDPKGAIPGDNEYSRLSDDEYDSDPDAGSDRGSDSESESDMYPETASETSECEQMPAKFPDVLRKRMNKSPTSVIFGSILQEEEFLPE